MVHWPTRSPLRFSFTRFQARLLRRKFVRAGLQHQNLSVENGDLAVWVGGDGPPLLLLQGFGASALWQFHPQVRALARSHCLVIPDLLFFGGSTSPEGERSVGYQAETMIQMMDSLGFKQFDLMGLSYGGFVAIAMGAEHPHRIRRLILNNSPGLGMTRVDYQFLLDTFGVAHPRDVFLPTQPAGVRGLMELAWHRPPPLPAFAMRDAYRNLFHNQVSEKRELLDELVSHLDRPGFEVANYDGMKGPVLIIWGIHDRVFPVHLAHRLQKDLGSRARLEILSRTAHAPNLERPRLFNRLVLRFLAQ